MYNEEVGQWFDKFLRVLRGVTTQAGSADYQEMILHEKITKRRNILSSGIFAKFLTTLELKVICIGRMKITMAKWETGHVPQSKELSSRLKIID
jgi:hypothetical protein